MDYVRLGQSDLTVSRICLGCMSFGTPGKGLHKWALDEADSRSLIHRALDLGITFFDTANVYSQGRSEEIVGTALATLARREEVVIATKVGLPMGGTPDLRGLSRSAIHAAVDASLSRLRTDYVDLYIVHRPEPQTPIEESLEALNTLVVSGKVRHLGASTMLAWEFARMLDVQRANGWAEFVSMQNYYNLLYREEEREMVPLCLNDEISITPWSPLARGRLAGRARGDTERSRTDSFGERLLGATVDIDQPVVDQVAAVAADKGVTPAQVALAWLLQTPPVVAPVMGATNPVQVEEACAATTLQLTDEEMHRLESAYLPHPLAEMTLSPLQPRLR